MPGGEIDPLIGRDTEIAEIRARLARHRLVTLTGPGGAGKTRLAQAVVDATRADIEALLVDLSNVTSGADLAPSLVASLQIPADDDMEAALHGWARFGPRLLALDNVEQIRDARQPIVDLLEAGPDIRILVTSRSPIGARGEHEYPVRPLDLPASDQPDDVERSAAGALFLERARALGRLTGQLDPEVAADVAALCRRLDGLPLAIELAAARTRLLPPASILRRLDEHDLGILRRQGGAARHRSLEAVLDWSLGLMTRDERRVLAACAVCAGTFDLGLIAAIEPDVDTVNTLDALVAYGMVVPVDYGGDDPRFRLLETVRMGMLAGDPDADTLRDGHAKAVLEIARRWVPAIDEREPRRALAVLDAERPNIEAAVNWLSRSQPGLAAELIAEVAGYYISRDAYAIPISWLQQLLPRLESDARGRAFALGTLVRVHGNRGEEVIAMDLAPEALRLAQELGMQGMQFEVLIRMFVAGIDSGRIGDRAALGRQLAELTPSNTRQLFLSLVPSIFMQGEYVVDRPATEAALDRLRAAGAVRPMTFALVGLAYDDFRAARFAEAAAKAGEAAEVGRVLGEAGMEAPRLIVAAVAHAAGGNWVAAEAEVRRAMVLSLAAASPDVRMMCLRASGAVAIVADRPLDAAWLFGAAERAYAPTPLADPTDDRVSGMGALWRTAKRQIPALEWQAARRDGLAGTDDEATARALAIFSQGPARPTVQQRLRHGTLTPREVEILTLVGEGRSDADIAERLFISAKTASVHVGNVKAKLGAKTRIEVALRARELGLVAAAG